MNEFLFALVFASRFVEVRNLTKDNPYDVIEVQLWTKGVFPHDGVGVGQTILHKGQEFNAETIMGIVEGVANIMMHHENKTDGYKWMRRDLINKYNDATLLFGDKSIALLKDEDVY